MERDGDRRRDNLQQGRVGSHRYSVKPQLSRRDAGGERRNTSLLFTEDCTDCFGTQKKDEPNDKEKKEDEDMLTPVHHSIIETWDWGRQPGEGRGGGREVDLCWASECGYFTPLCFHVSNKSARWCRKDAMIQPA